MLCKFFRPFVLFSALSTSGPSWRCLRPENSFVSRLSRLGNVLPEFGRRRFKAISIVCRFPCSASFSTAFCRSFVRSFVGLRNRPETIGESLVRRAARPSFRPAVRTWKTGLYKAAGGRLLSWNRPPACHILSSADTLPRYICRRTWDASAPRNDRSLRRTERRRKIPEIFILQR